MIEPDGTNPSTSHPTGEDDKDDELCHSARWQASEQLLAFLGTLHKPLSALREKRLLKITHVQILIVFTLPLWIAISHHSCLATRTINFCKITC